METLINKTFSKGTEVKAQVNSLTLKVESLECKFRVYDKEIGNLKAGLEFTSNSLEDLKSTQGNCREEEKAEKSRLRKEEIAHVEGYSRRENLIVSTEEKKLEDTASVLRTFMASTFQTEHP